MSGICKHNHDADFCKDCTAERRLAANAAYGKCPVTKSAHIRMWNDVGEGYFCEECATPLASEYKVQQNTKPMLPRITVRDHGDIHALINAMELAVHTLEGTRDDVEAKDRQLLVELLEAAKLIHMDIIIDDVTHLLTAAPNATPEEYAREMGQRVATLIVHPFHD